MCKALNIPEGIYRASDFLLGPIVGVIVSLNEIEKRLKNEQELFGKSAVEYCIEAVNIIHARAGAMVSHLSIMLAICLFLLQNGVIIADDLRHLIVLGDTIIYLVLVILSVRCLRSFGLDEDRESIKAYEVHLLRELTFKYGIMQVVNAFTILATIVLVAVMTFTFLIKAA